MSNAKRDQNNVPALITVLNTDGKTITPLQASPTSHLLKVNDGVTGSDLGPTNAARDENFVHTLVAVSSGDNETPIVLYGDSSGKLLIQST